MVLDAVSFDWHTRVTPDKDVVRVICEVLLVKMPFFRSSSVRRLLPYT
jgi:hypothetical protein